MKHYVIQGERGTGKSTLANFLAQLLFEEDQVFRTSFTAELEKLRPGTDLSFDMIIIDECPDPASIMKASDWLFHSVGISEKVVVFITNVSCSTLSKAKFRVINCRYCSAREDFVHTPLTLMN